MSSTLNILRKRRKRQNNPDARLQRGSRNTLAGCGFTLSIFFVFGIFSLVLSYQSLIKDLPALIEIEVLLNPRNGALLQPTRIYDHSGEELIYIFAPEDKTRRYIPVGTENPQHIPNSLLQATIALADPDFWAHEGYSIRNFDPESHPTLAQKLVADLLLWGEEPSLRRAIRERLLAAQITQKYGRQQITEWYLNSANYGHYAYGAEAAAQLYFDKPVTDLDLAESATLAAASQIPTLNPLDAPIPAYQRRQETLYIMVELNMLDADKADAARSVDFNLPSFNELENPAPAFLPLMLKQLSAFYPQERIERGGLEIISTLDIDLQKESACILEAQIARLSKRNIEECDAAQLLPTLPAMDILNNARASALIIDPQNGQILAAIGEIKLNGESAFLAAGKAGTSLTPFIYLTGFTRGLSPASLLWDIPTESEIQNFDGEFHGPVSLRTALANDYIIPMEKVLAQMGAENLRKISQSFGLEFDAENSAEATPSIMDMTQAYGVFAAEGLMHGQFIEENIEAATILKLSDVEGEIWLDWQNEDSQAVISPQLAYLMNDILSDDAARWQSLGTPNVLELGFPSAAKMGQHEEGLSAWAVGYTPQRVIAIWAGADEPFDYEIVGGVWQALMKKASTDLPPSDWEIPLGVTEVDICDPSGLLPTADCPNIISEVFLNGTEPSQYDNLYRSFDVNRETGYLATVFTSPELVEEKEYLLVPTEAKAWAESAGIENPPNGYDAILAPPHLPDAHFTSPSFFDDVKGVLEIRGTAAGEDFDYYRMQVGQGLNPKTWMQIGEDIHGSITNNLLAIWDTSELSGLYAIQLLVVRKDKRIDIATTQISIDNEAPTMQILYPEMGETLNYQLNRQIELQANASDNLGVNSVEFYVDFQQVGVVTESPYTWTWATSTGSHHLKIIVRDRAGNMVEEIIRFKVE
ncbi:MAG: hypothetical protein HN392_09085 [Anaerolineae bacterium]|nr:hypothetical protein [Anaerolineae bacterium]MBT7783296.1 hypothetical protein [Anaerolineae bacterium]